LTGAGGSDLAERLRQGAQALGLNLTDGQVDALLAYQALILKWNKVYNLTAVRTPEEMLTHHLLDSLAVVPLVQRQVGAGGARLLDVGSGAGLPGVVIAVCCPSVQVDCVDTVAKKAAFVQQAAAQLGLPNLRGVHARVENLAGPYEIVTSRAFSSLADFTIWSGAALAPGGVWLAMKGKHPAAELEALPAGVTVFHVEQLHVPGLDAERCAVWMRKSGEAAANA
jgi:16S rRNA (guanine527-N7)-methyltransferase